MLPTLRVAGGLRKALVAKRRAQCTVVVIWLVAGDVLCTTGTEQAKQKNTDTHGLLKKQFFFRFSPRR
jgi:hypothetical protein